MSLAPGDLNLADPLQLAAHSIPPHDYFDILRGSAPVHWNPPPPDDPRGHRRLVHKGFWVLSKYDDVKLASRDYERFSAWKGGVLIFDAEDVIGFNGHPGGEAALESQRAGLMGMDPPDHATFRRLIQGIFTPRRVAALEPNMEAHARRIVDDLARAGAAEFVMDTAAQLPVLVLCDLMGVPPEDRQQYFRWANAIANAEDPTIDQFTVAFELLTYCLQLVEERRKQPDHTMLSAYANAVVDGHQLSDAQIAMFFVTLSIAGHETTRNTTAHFVRLMDEHPDQKALLLEDLDGRLPNAIEEVLRCSPPVMDFRRTATQDVVLRDVTVREGDKVYLSYVSANRDEEVFEDPHRFDILRPNASDHLSFGIGPHFCLGASLARTQLRMLLGELYRRIPDISVAEPATWIPSVWFNALAKMPVSTAPKAA